MGVDPAIAWRVLSLLMLAWLAFFFGRTLLPGRTPLITRIALVSTPDLPPAVQRYARRLTAVWSAYFVLATLLALAGAPSGAWVGPLVGVGSIVLFVGEHRLRPHLFPGQDFPSLRQQLTDTWSVWRPANRREG